MFGASSELTSVMEFGFNAATDRESGESAGKKNPT